MLNNTSKRTLALTVASLAVALLMVPVLASTIELTETGSTLLYPLMTAWVDAYESSHPDVRIVTAATGSGIGIAQAASGAATFGASDAAVPDPRTSGVDSIPLAISAQHIGYHISGIDPGTNVRLSAPLLAAIYSGAITHWNDPRIAALNADLAAKLPATTIVPIRREDASGDTFLFTEYLRVAGGGAWSAGSGTRVNWPSVPGEQLAKQNRDVVQLLAAINGSIGYVGISYLEQTKNAGVGIIALRNRSGAFVLPDDAAIAATVATERSDGPGAPSLIDLPGAKSYPIVNVEYAIVRTHGYDAQTASALRGFLGWTIDPAGGNASPLLAPVHFVALPDRLRARSRAQIAEIQ
jgi:phosphate transport system substrate-binding protein